MGSPLLSTNLTTKVFAINNAAAQSRQKRLNQIKMLACPPHTVNLSAAGGGVASARRDLFQLDSKIRCRSCLFILLSTPRSLRGPSVSLFFHPHRCASHGCPSPHSLTRFQGAIHNSQMSAGAVPGRFQEKRGKERRQRETERERVRHPANSFTDRAPRALRVN